MSVLVGKNAPDFEATAVISGDFKENFRLSDFNGQYRLLFFYPLDFTFVCPTELHAFQEKLADFERLNCQVIACSVDSHFSHNAWLQVDRNKGGIKGIKYPLVSDINKTIAKDYDVLISKDGIALRGAFLIDKEGVVRHQVVNDLPLGRNVDEFLRLLEALQFTEKNGEVCPANWNKGEKAMQPNHSSLNDYMVATAK